MDRRAKGSNKKKMVKAAGGEGGGEYAAGDENMCQGDE